MEIQVQKEKPLFRRYLSLIKFSHTIFAMPFALTGYFMGYAATGEFDGKMLALVILCMVFARSAAMAFNRLIDRDIDARNKRTKVREIPAGEITPKNALFFVIANSILFIATTWFINPLCFALSPVALLVVLGYSYTKRFTALCHLVLGLGLSLAPVGAFLAVTGYFHYLPVLLGVAVLTWVSGFDIIYALQDEEFDKENKLKSIPAYLGKKNALMVSNLLHVISAGSIISFCYLMQTGPLSWIGAGLFISLLIYQHLLVKPGDLRKVNLAFFTTNGIASVIFAVLVITDMLIRI